MPNRYVREAAITSKAVNSLSWQAEVFWRRLLNKVDDFGRFTAEPDLLLVEVFPRQLNRVREADIPRLLTDCEKAGLLYRYEAGDKAFLVMNQWECGRAQKSKYPPPPEHICKQMQTHVYNGLQMSPAPTPTLTPTPNTGISYDKASKPGRRSGETEAGRVTSGAPPPARLGQAQLELAKTCEHLLNGQWVNDAGKWINRIKSHAPKVQRVMAEVELARREQRITTTPAQYAEQIWKEFT